MSGSDLGRKDFSSKVQETVTPQSQKSTTEKVSESVTGAGDKAARSAQPDDTKSTTQTVTDKVSHDKDSAKPSSNESIIDKAKNTVGLGDKHT